MGCAGSKKFMKHVSIEDPIENTNLKSTPDAFVIGNSKKFTDVYKIGKPLGSGSYGEVRSVVHRITNQERAVKIFRKDLDHQNVYMKVKSEISILRKISHPIIIKMYEFFEDEKRIYQVLEKCDGGELFEEVFKKKFLSEKTAAVICKQLFSAIAFLHENKIVHRDIKPENILLEEREDFFNIKIIDFGAATNFDGVSKLTEMIGSAFYIAPEVARYNYNEKCDMWSSGVILYILLCGTPPFGGVTNEEIIKNIKKGEYSFESSIWTTVSNEAKDLIRKLLCPQKTRLSAQEALLHPWIRSTATYPVPSEDFYAQAIHNLKAFHSINKLRDSISIFISSQIINIHETKELRELFKAIDVNGDGKLSKEEMINGFSKVNGIESSEEFIENIMNEVDTDKNGYIDYNEFLKATISQGNLYSKSNLKKAFDMFDLDGSGKISSHELQQIFSIGNFSNGAWEKIVREADKNSDGEIDFDEFCQFIIKLSEETNN